MIRAEVEADGRKYIVAVGELSVDVTMVLNGIHIRGRVDGSRSTVIVDWPPHAVFDAVTLALRATPLLMRLRELYGASVELRYRGFKVLEL